MPKQDSQLKIINVIEPTMCLRCRSAHIAEVLFTDGSTRKMFYCSRLDCDNWCAPLNLGEAQGQAHLDLGDITQDAA